MDPIDKKIHDAWMTLYNTNRPMLHQFLVRHPLIEKQLLFHFKMMDIVLPVPSEDDRVDCEMALKILKSVR